ncbi:hypothetical protein BUALT_Bualt19G0080700 [Buddleja alternifolia]|uniref:Uncharacterized protein n=1 Tax=Buddleja alternifolia TaxID=168488 RepID=A0AAV6W2T8_9LAMI|nr:hypothetical protein BUALT_Bualt19G0080700 [Buddleja alternifolia]
MPTFTTIALENLLEPTVRNSRKDPLHGGLEDTNPRNEGPRHLYISSPALYATPEQAPIPECSPPEPRSPSPYVVNFKRRRGGNERRSEVVESPTGNEGEDLSLEEEEEVVEDNFVNRDLDGNDDVGEDAEGFLDSMSVGSEVEASDFVANHIESRSFVSAQGEFFDANDDFSSDGSISYAPSYNSRIESELKASRVSLLEEIERGKSAEEALVLMRSQWERIRKHMSEAGLTFPPPPAASDSMQLENNLVDHLSQEIVVTRFVAEAVGRGQARAEAEEAANAIIESKDQEILRLRDRLQYYETVNHEMSQRKLVEVARRQQERKQSRRRWLWSFMGLSVAIGASFVAYTYIPQTSECSSADSTDASCVNPSEAS